MSDVLYRAVPDITLEDHDIFDVWIKQLQRFHADLLIGFILQYPADDTAFQMLKRCHINDIKAILIGCGCSGHTRILIHTDLIHLFFVTIDKTYITLKHLCLDLTRRQI